MQKNKQRSETITQQLEMKRKVSPLTARAWGAWIGFGEGQEGGGRNRKEGKVGRSVEKGQRVK